MQSQPCLIIDRDLERFLHKLFTRQTNLLVQSCREHLNLLLVRGHLENCLHISAHIECFQHLVALI